MKISDKIKKFRLLRGLTQKQLGEKVGFPSLSADIRINQYETAKMKPKQDISDKIAKALDIDEELLFESKIENNKEIIATLFELCERNSLKVNIIDGQPYCSFDPNDNNKQINDFLIQYANKDNELKNKISKTTLYGIDYIAEKDIDNTKTEFEEWFLNYIKEVQ